MRVIVNNIATNYQTFGSGPSIILLHGWADSIKSWEPMASMLAKSFNIISLDLPGFGDTESPDEAWDLNNYACFVRDFLNKIKVQPVAIIGHSNGGAIAIKGLVDGNLNSEKLILLASAGIRNSDSGRKKTLKIIAKTGKVTTSILPSKYQDQIKSKFYKKIGSDALIVPHMRKTFENVVSEDLEQLSSKIKLPTLLVYGAKDQSTPAIYGEKFHKNIKNSKLILIENAGHFIHTENYEEVSNYCQEFLTGKLS